MELAEMFRPMGDPSRLRIILACLQEPTCGSGPAARTQLSPCLIGHLFTVRAARLLRAEGLGKQVFYSPAAEYVRRAITELAAHVGEPAALERLKVMGALAGNGF